MPQNLIDDQDNTDSDNALVLSDSKPLLEPILTQIYKAAIWRDEPTISWHIKAEHHFANDIF